MSKTQDPFFSPKSSKGNTFAKPRGSLPPISGDKIKVSNGEQAQKNGKDLL
jgi:hypothetical protein